MSDLETLGNDIRDRADPASPRYVPTIGDALQTRNYDTVAAWYNDSNNAQAWGIRSDIAKQEIINAVNSSQDFASFTTNDLLGMILVFGDTYRPGPPLAREWLDTLFAGAQSTRINVLGVVNREMTPAEELYLIPATGPGGGDGSQQTQAANFGVLEGPINARTVRDALAATA